MTATDLIHAVETCLITEAEALERSGAETMVALYRLAILELAPHLHAANGRSEPRSTARPALRARAA